VPFFLAVSTDRRNTLAKSFGWYREKLPFSPGGTQEFASRLLIHQYWRSASEFR